MLTDRAFKLRFCIMFSVLFVSSFSIATAEEGQHRSLLRTAIEAAARGECPQKLMAPLLVSACEDQQPSIGTRINSRGKINRLKYMGNQASQMGEAEVYRVIHERGSMTWMINTDSNGKILVFYTPG